MVDTLGLLQDSAHAAIWNDQLHLTGAAIHKTELSVDQRMNETVVGFPQTLEREVVALLVSTVSLADGAKCPSCRTSAQATGTGGEPFKGLWQVFRVRRWPRI